MVRTNPDSARQTAVRLYVTRQEEIEARWGDRSERGSGSALAEAVTEAETRFHELMQALSATPPPDSSAVASRVRALDAQLADVLTKAGEDRE